MPVISIKTGEAPVEIMTFPMGQEHLGGQWSAPIVIAPESEQDIALGDGMHIRARPCPSPPRHPRQRKSSLKPEEERPMHMMHYPLALIGTVVMLARSSSEEIGAPLHIAREGMLPSPSSFGRITTHFDPRINVNTGKPHAHAREVARRARQMERRAARAAVA
ncbi:MAG: hypothetical protein U5M50_10450 [Sphingobium sp.]|nr:hypothetical protein [Sphingobium sp.]